MSLRVHVDRVQVDRATHGSTVAQGNNVVTNRTISEQNNSTFVIGDGLIQQGSERRAVVSDGDMIDNWGKDLRRREQR